MQAVGSSEQGVVLESIGPPTDVLVVVLEEIVFGGMLPLGDWFLGDGNVREVLGQEVKEDGLAAADVALNRIDYFLH